jgi:hypothetical protein
MGLVVAAWVAGTVFLFKHPAELNFTTWAGLVATVTGVFHWLTVADAKKPDEVAR